jgi:hypothetical protein
VSNFDALFDFVSGPNHDGKQLAISDWVLGDCWCWEIVLSYVRVKIKVHFTLLQAKKPRGE